MSLPAMAGDTVYSQVIVLSISENRNERTTGNGWMELGHLAYTGGHEVTVGLNTKEGVR